MFARLRRLAVSVISGALVLSFGAVRPAGAQEPPQPARTISPDPSGSDSPSGDDTLDAASGNLALADMGIEQLSRVDVVVPALDMPVTSVARQESTVGRSPAAVFVVTQEMIRRSGARNIPEVLRMVPGVHVARIDSNKWAITARGGNDRFANKLLVQIDGRSVYTPLFAGTFWDVQDVLLEDIERIEVIRGPGATVWGANAVNGVINIITKHAKDTQGGFIIGGAGTEERGFTGARVGGKLADDFYYRVYGKWFERDEGFLAGDANHDDWRQSRGGFRADWEADCCNQFTVQGDYYDGNSGSRQVIPTFVAPFERNVDDDQRVSGGNVLMRWTQQQGKDTDWALQFYYDRTERHSSLFAIDRDTIDLDFQHRFPLNEYHRMIWGAGYRFSKDFVKSDPFFVQFDPVGRSIDLFSYFAQDEITLVDDLLYFIVGSKFEHNDFTQFEFQPSTRLLWTPDERHSGWASISRAVRTPSRADSDVRAINVPTSAVNPLDPMGPSLFPVFPVLTGSPAVESEDLLAYELGFRAQPVDRFSWDVALFYHDYENLISLVPTSLNPGPPITATVPFNNGMRGETYGIELAANLELTDAWRLYGAYSYLDIFLHPDPDDDDLESEGTNPHNKVYFMSSWDLGCSWELDWITRYVDSLPFDGIASYLTMDVRLGWRPHENTEIAIVGQNLLDAEHLEFGEARATGTPSTEVQRGFYGMFTRRF